MAELDVVRHNVGVRPARSIGLRVEKERMDGEDVVHAYGEKHFAGTDSQTIADNAKAWLAADTCSLSARPGRQETWSMSMFINRRLQSCEHLFGQVVGGRRRCWWMCVVVSSMNSSVIELSRTSLPSWSDISVLLW